VMRLAASVVIPAVMVAVVRLRKTANKLWPWGDKELAACDVDL
jgi:hypothetical protein